MLLDSTFLIDLLDQLDAAEHMLTELINRETPVSVSPLSMYETGLGLHDYEHQRFTTVIESKSVIVHPLSLTESRQALSIQRTLHDRGEPIGDVDSLIAATARAHDETVLTRNVDEFARIDGISVETY